MKPIHSVFHVGAIAVLACCLVAASRAETLAMCSPDGIHVASIGEHGRVFYVRAEDNRVVHTFYICHAQTLAFSTDGKLLAAGGRRNGCQAKIKVWRMADDKQLCEIVADMESIRTLAVSADEKLVAAADANGTVVAWRISDGAGQWSRSLPSIRTIHFTPDSRRVLVERPDGTQRWLDSAKGRNLGEPEGTTE